MPCSAKALYLQKGIYVVILYTHCYTSMKTLFLLFALMAVLQVHSYAQSDSKSDNAQTQDTLTWYVYIPGKSESTRREAEKKVAAEWGIRMSYFFGDCTGTYNDKIEEFNKQNETLFAYLSDKHGQDWKRQFDKQVDEKIKKNNGNH